MGAVRSRFGKLTMLHFIVESPEAAKAEGREVPNCKISGFTFETYLLEKSRVVSHVKGERTYHLFYQLLKAPEDEKVELWENLEGTTCDSFRFVGEPEIHGTDGRTDAEAWSDTRDALSSLGFKPGRGLKTLMRAVCCVLQLGNITFSIDPSDDEGAILSSTEELDKLCSLMGVFPATFRDALCLRQTKVPYGEDIVVRLTPASAKDGCDALAKEMYTQIFQTLTETINGITEPQDSRSKMGRVSILDMFGFENFTVNRFEQFCINYANEKIQNKFVSDTFLLIRVSALQTDTEGKFAASEAYPLTFQLFL